MDLQTFSQAMVDISKWNLKRLLRLDYLTQVPSAMSQSYMHGLLATSSDPLTPPPSPLSLRERPRPAPRMVPDPGSPHRPGHLPFAPAASIRSGKPMPSKLEIIKNIINIIIKILTAIFVIVSSILYKYFTMTWAKQIGNRRTDIRGI